MLRQGTEMGLEATAPQKASATKMMPEMNSVSESAGAALSLSPTESEIATVAYQLWLEKGCPIGSSQEDWFRAEAMLRNALVKWEDSFRRPLIRHCDTRTEPDVVAEFDSKGWQGHWEVWEREYVGARWVWDFRDPGVGGSNRARPSGKAAEAARRGVGGV